MKSLINRCLRNLQKSWNYIFNLDGEELVLSLKKEKVPILENKSTRIRNTEIVLNMALSSKWTRRLASQAGNVGSIPARATS